MEELKDFLIVIIMTAILIAGFTILLSKIDIKESNSTNSNNFVIQETLRQQTRNLLFRR